MSEVYASGSWHVKEGSEASFIEAWNEFLQGSAGGHPALIRASLHRDQNDPRHFVSMARWADEASRSEWKNGDAFAKGFQLCRSLCDDFYGSDYDLTTQIVGEAASAVTA